MNASSNGGSRAPARRGDDVIGSAESVAFARALTALDPDPAIRGPDALAQELISPSLRAMLAQPQLLRAEIDRRFPGAYGFHIARTKHTDRLLLEEVRRGVQQVVLLGAGLDTRAFRFREQLAGVRIFELDFPGNQKQKLQRIQEASWVIPPNISYVPIDFSTQSLERVLHEAGVDATKHTFFIWDGVSYYLARETVEGVLRYIGHPRQARRSVVFDYALRSFVEGDHSTYGSREVAEYFSSKGEPFLFGLEPDEVRPFLLGCGLDLVLDLGPNELNRAYVMVPGATTPPPFVGLYRISYAQNRSADDAA